MHHIEDAIDKCCKGHEARCHVLVSLHELALLWAADGAIGDQSPECIRLLCVSLMWDGAALLLLWLSMSQYDVCI